MDERLIKEYLEYKSVVDEYTKKVKTISEKLKLELDESNLDEIEVNDYMVSRSIVNQDKLNEDKLIEILSKTLPTELKEKIIKTREYLDLDELENACYNRLVNADMVESCVEHKEPSIRLYVRRKKNG